MARPSLVYAVRATYNDGSNASRRERVVTCWIAPGMRKFFITGVVLVWSMVCVVARADAPVTVVVEGLSGELQKNVLALLTLEQQKNHPALTPERIRRLHKKAPSEIEAALQPFGYYRPKIQAELNEEVTPWQARYIIDPGPAIKLAAVEVTLDGAGAQDSVLLHERDKFPLKPGDVLEHARYEQGKKELLQLAAERGYLDAQFDVSEIRIDTEAYEASIVLHLVTAAPFRFGALKFNQDEFDPVFLSRYAAFKPGDPFSFSKLLDLQNALTDSDYFSQVDVHADRDNATEGEVPVSVDAIARDRTKYTMGLGYGTDTGARGSVGVERRRVTPTGHRLRADLRVSEVGNSLTTRYIIPLERPRTDQFALTAGREEQRLSDSSSKKYLLSGSYSRLDNGWQKTLYLNVERDVSFSVGDQTGDSILVMPGLNWTRVRANDRIYTTFGHRFVVDVRGGSSTLGSTTSFLQTRINTKFVRRFASVGRVIARADVGYTRVDTFTQLPPSVRFFAGGDNSVRGYDYNTLGPEENGKVVGGTHLAVTSLEYEQIVTEDWSAAVFIDAGNATNNFTDPLKRGAGIGVRYRSPIGLVRIDLARHLDPALSPRYIHLSIGPDL